MTNSLAAGRRNEKPLLKVYGERNTGTNYLSKLLDLNIQVTEIPGTVPGYVNRLLKPFPEKVASPVRDLFFKMTFHRNLGWKHMLIDAESLCKHSLHLNGLLSFITITKNPYSWLLSFYARPYNPWFPENLEFEEFLNTPVVTFGRENAPKLIANPVELWNLKNSAYIKLKERLPTINLKYEDVVDNPKRTLEIITNEFSYEWKEGSFENYEASTKEKGKNTGFYREYYLNERWKDKISLLAMEIINKRLNRNVVDYFDYAVLSNGAK